MIAEEGRPGRLATVDLGTNTVRLLVVEAAGGAWRPLHQTQRVTRLGEGQAAAGRLLPEPMRRTAVAVAEFARAARGLGATPMRQVLRHILPNAVGPVIVAGSLDVAVAIIAESTLSFLGLGFPPDIPTWGRILYDAKDNLDFAPHWALFPGTAIFLTVLSINYIGDGLRDALDPRKVLAR